MIFRQQCQSGFLYHFEKFHVLWKSNVYRLTEWRHLTDVRRNRERTSIFTVQCVWVRAVVDMVTDMLCTRTFWVRTQLPDIAYNTCFNITLFSWCRSVCCGIRAPTVGVVQLWWVNLHHLNALLSSEPSLECACSIPSFWVQDLMNT